MRIIRFSWNALLFTYFSHFHDACMFSGLKNWLRSSTSPSEETKKFFAVCLSDEWFVRFSVLPIRNRKYIVNWKCSPNITRIVLSLRYIQYCEYLENAHWFNEADGKDNVTLNYHNPDTTRLYSVLITKFILFYSYIILWP